MCRIPQRIWAYRKVVRRCSKVEFSIVVRWVQLKYCSLWALQVNKGEQTRYYARLFLFNIIYALIYELYSPINATPKRVKNLIFDRSGKFVDEHRWPSINVERINSLYAVADSLNFISLRWKCSFLSCCLNVLEMREPQGRNFDIAEWPTNRKINALKEIRLCQQFDGINSGYVQTHLTQWTTEKSDLTRCADFSHSDAVKAHILGGLHVSSG